MAKKIAPMSAEQLKKDSRIPKVYRKAIEQAVFEMTDTLIGPTNCMDYYRAYQVETLLACEIKETDKPDQRDYNYEAAWFKEGWDAKTQSLLLN